QARVRQKIEGICGLIGFDHRLEQLFRSRAPVRFSQTLLKQFLQANDCDFWHAFGERFRRFDQLDRKLSPCKWGERYEQSETSYASNRSHLFSKSGRRYLPV